MFFYYDESLFKTLCVFYSEKKTHNAAVTIVFVVPGVSPAQQNRWRLLTCPVCVILLCSDLTDCLFSLNPLVFPKLWLSERNCSSDITAAALSQSGFAYLFLRSAKQLLCRLDLSWFNAVMRLESARLASTP